MLGHSKAHLWQKLEHIQNLLSLIFAPKTQLTHHEPKLGPLLYQRALLQHTLEGQLLDTLRCQTERQNVCLNEHDVFSCILQKSYPYFAQITPCHSSQSLILTSEKMCYALEIELIKDIWYSCSYYMVFIPEFHEGFEHIRRRV